MGMAIIRHGPSFKSGSGHTFFSDEKHRYYIPLRVNALVVGRGRRPGRGLELDENRAVIPCTPLVREGASSLVNENASSFHGSHKLNPTRNFRIRTPELDFTNRPKIVGASGPGLGLGKSEAQALGPLKPRVGPSRARLGLAQGLRPDPEHHYPQSDKKRWKHIERGYQEKFAKLK
ncbi:hypothetical protein C8R44DRAFT_747557 [Mycena epipterygia]|nr:hypothetical protein C8R44DRAFT_747557 [Mycena epipterygia]